MAGVALCFLPDLLGAAKPPSAFVWGMVAMVVAALTSSVGAVCSIKLNRMQVPVVTYTAWAMMYGAIATALYGAFSGQSLQLDGRLSFWLAFLYLSVAGTIIAFLCYLLYSSMRARPARCTYRAVAGWCGDCFQSCGRAASASTHLGWNPYFNGWRLDHSGQQESLKTQRSETLRGWGLWITAAVRGCLAVKSGFQLSYAPRFSGRVLPSTDPHPDTGVYLFIYVFAYVWHCFRFLVTLPQSL